MASSTKPEVYNYCIVVRGGPSHGHMRNMRRKFCEDVVLEMRADRHTDALIISASVCLSARISRTTFTDCSSCRFDSVQPVAGRPLVSVLSRRLTSGQTLRALQEKETRSHPEMVGDMSRVTLDFDLSKIPFVHF